MTGLMPHAVCRNTSAVDPCARTAAPGATFLNTDWATRRYVDVPGFIVADTSDIRITGWLRTNDAGANRYAVCLGGGDPRIAVITQGGGAINLGGAAVSGGVSIRSINDDLTNPFSGTGWHSFDIQFDATNISGQVDDDPPVSLPLAPAVPPNMTTGANLYLGAFGGNVNSFGNVWLGDLSHIKVCIDGVLRGYYRLDDIAGTVVPDSSGNGLDGTLN